MPLSISKYFDSEQEETFLKNLCKLLGHDRTMLHGIRYCQRCGKNFNRQRDT
jgi:hypothetical protein